MPDQLADSLANLMKAQKVKTAAVMTLQLPYSLEVRQFLLPALKKAGIDGQSVYDHLTKVLLKIQEVTCNKLAIPSY